MRRRQTYLRIPGLQGFEIKGRVINDGAKEQETERSHGASKMKRDRNEGPQESPLRSRRSGRMEYFEFASVIEGKTYFDRPR